MARNDPHAPSNINPRDYELALCYAFATTRDGWPIPAQNVDLLVEMLRKEHFAYIHEGTNQCDICGAVFIEGEVWKHVPTGEHITVGHQCAAKYDFARDLEGWEADRERHIRGAVTRALRKAKLLEAVSVLRDRLAGNDHLKAALRRNKEHDILADILRRALRFGTISEAQEALCLKIVADLDRPAEEFTGTAPTGRQAVEGRILATKTYDGVYGTSYKMLVAVEGDDGTWKGWGTIPQALFDAVRDEREAILAELTEATNLVIEWNMARGRGTAGWYDELGADRRDLERDLKVGEGFMDVLRGRTVRFTGTFAPGNDGDPHFARFSRPAKAGLV